MPVFEIRLLGGPDGALFFQTIKPDLALASEHAELLLRTHDEFEGAEIWNGLKCMKVLAP